VPGEAPRVRPDLGPNAFMLLQTLAIARNTFVESVRQPIYFVLLMAGYPLVLDAFSGWAPRGVVDAVEALSFLSHFQSISRGVIDIRDLIYFAGMIVFFLFANVTVIETAKAE